MTATLKDVANAAGVSIRTAGRALHGDGPVKTDVAERVRDAARNLHYIPNAAARNLRRRSSRIVGIVIGMNFSTEAGQRRLAALEGKLREYGFYVLIGSLPSNESALNELLREWAGIVRKVIFLDWHPEWTAETLAGLPQHFLFFDTPMPDGPFDFLQTDRASGVAAAIAVLIRSGRKRIACVFNSGARGRRDGVARAAAGKPVELISIESAGLEMEDGFAAGDRIAASGADAAFFSTDRMALGFYRYAHEHGIAIPERIAVAGFDNDSAGGFAIPTLTTVAHPDAEAVQCAADWAADSGDAPLRRVFPTLLMERESSRRC